MDFSLSHDFDLSPVRLTYIAALRNVRPRKPGVAFHYLQITPSDQDAFLCLAASNPDGRFLALMENDAEAMAWGEEAATRQILNASFITKESDLPDQIDYMSFDAPEIMPSDDQKAKIFSLAEKLLKDSGIFAYRYKAYEKEEDILAFLLDKYADELSEEQAVEFLTELTQSNPGFFARHDDIRSLLEESASAENVQLFFDKILEKGCPRSGTFEAMEGLLPRNFSPAGDADISANFLELAAPQSAHEHLIKRQKEILYEPYKDFVLSRLVRNDVWVKLPADRTLEKPELIGGFTFGIARQAMEVPSSATIGGKEVSFETPLFKKLIRLLSSLPTSVGDFLHHPDGKDYRPDEVINAIQLLVALGLAVPMRAHYEGQIKETPTFPQWSNSFNASYQQKDFNQDVVRLASSVTGSSITLPLSEALVIQSLARVGLENISGMFQITAKKLSEENPALLEKISESKDLSDDTVYDIVIKSLNDNMARWYAFGILSA